MSSFAINGGKVSEEGHGKPWLHMFRQGYARGLSLTQRAAGANMSVDVNLDGSGYGSAFVTTSAGVCYFGWIDAATNVTVTTSNPSNPRIDTVVAYVDLSLITSSTTNNVGAFKLLAVAGTAAATPTAPNSSAMQSAVGAGNPYVVLGNIAVGAAASNIVTANIADLRVPAALAMPYLFGGSNGTKGHQVPNVADGTVVVSTDTGTVGPALLAAGAISLGDAPIVSNFTTTSTTSVQATGLSVAVTIPAGGRRIEVTAFTDYLYCTTSGGIVTMEIWDGPVGTGSVISRAVIYASAANTGAPATVIARVSPSAGAKTYNVGLKTSTGTGGIEAGPTFPAFISVKAV